MIRLRRRGRTGLVLLGVAVLGAVLALRLVGGRVEEYRSGEATEGIVDELARDVPDDHPRVTFRDVADASGLRFRHFPAQRTNRLPEDMGSGVALGDFDGDGWTDVFLANLAGALPDAESWDESGRSRLFRNRGDGTFEDVTEASGLELVALANGAAFLDVDSDGDLDLFVSTYGTCRLFRNEGDLRFRDVSREAGLADLEGFWTGVAVADHDADGDLDVYVCGYVRYDEDRASQGDASSPYGRVIPVLINPSTFDPHPNVLLVNRGDGTFVDAAAEAGVRDERGRGLGALFCDLDGDGRPDLYVANDVSDNAFFLNEGDGTFRDATSGALLGDYRGAMGLAAGDWDGDQDLDLFITHWVAQENALYTQHPPREGAAGPPHPVFLDDSSRLGLGHTGLAMVGWATAFVDWDNDGRPDVFVVNGSTIPLEADRTLLEPQRAQLFWHVDEPRPWFHEIGAVCGDWWREPHVGRGGAAFDHDLDGDTDLVVVAHGAPAALLRNDGGSANAALRVRLRQPAGNRFAVGARVLATVGGRARLEVVGTQGSYLSQHAVGEVAFGLGDAGLVERLEVTWPDGTREVTGPLLAGSLVTWTRGTEPVVESFPGRRATDAAGPAAVEEQRRFYELRGEAQAARLDGEVERAVELYARCLALWPGHADCLYYLANCLVERGDERAALHVLERLVAFEPQSNKGWMQIGMLRLPGGAVELDDPGAAAAAFARCHELNGEESRPVLMLGVARMLLGAREDAAEHFADSARLNPRSVEARWFAGKLAWDAGDAEEAARLLAEARALAAETGAGGSASNEGDTATGRALTTDAGPPLAEPLVRWRSVASRSGDPAVEYGE